MFIKRTHKIVKGVKYENCLLVESVSTPKGSRHNVICSLGTLDAGPREKWLDMAHKVQKALAGQMLLEADPAVERIVAKARAAGRLGQPQPEVEPERQTAGAEEDDGFATINTKSVQMDDGCEAGPVHVAHQMWDKLEMGEVLKAAGLSWKAIRLTEIAVINRLVEPASEHAIRGWVERTALRDIFVGDLPPVNDTALYRNLDTLHPERHKIEQGLADVERKLFNMDQTIFLYDLTSTYFEGLCQDNKLAKRGYSRDHRSDCKQVVVGLVLNRDGFPTAHEIFDGNRVDTTTVDDMLTVLDKRTGGQKGLTVVVDRGMACKGNLESITRHKNKYHYIVASRQTEREQYLAEFESEQGWEEVFRSTSPTNPYQKKSRVIIKRIEQGGETHILCVSDGRTAKDKAIREAKEQKLLADLEKLTNAVASGKLAEDAKIHERIGRLKERYPRAARYYEISFDTQTRQLKWQENKELKERAAQLDGGYLLKTDRKDLSAEEIWHTYMLLTRVENAFRNLKGPLAVRPVFHQMDHRVETHIFICILAYHLLVAMEKLLLDAGIHSSWETIRKELTTHQIATVSMKAKNGSTLLIRQGINPNLRQKQIYQALKVPTEIIKPVRVWYPAHPTVSDCSPTATPATTR
jgi:transposase